MGLRPGAAAASGGASKGVGAPVALALGHTYYQLDGSGKVVGEWLGTSGGPVQVETLGSGGLMIPTSGAPSNAVGVDGDYAIDAAAGELYGPKAAGAWPAGVSIVGPAGSSGAALADGAVTSAKLADGAAVLSKTGPIVRTPYGPVPNGMLAENGDRGTLATAGMAVVSGTPRVATGLKLWKGMSIAALNVLLGGTSGSGTTAGLMALYALTGGSPLVTTPSVVGGYTASQIKSFPLSAAWVVPADMEVLAMLLLTAGTMPTLAGWATAGAQGVAPFGGTLAAGAAAAPDPMGAVTFGGKFYAAVS